MSPAEITLSLVQSPEELTAFTPGAAAPLAREAFLLTHPLVHLVAHDGSGAVLARCSLWQHRDRNGAPTRQGCIGHFAAADHAASRRESPAAAAVLARAAEILAAHGCTEVIGPLDGSTWHRYRFVTERGAEPPFFLEPDNPAAWPALFLDCGFRPLANYTSALVSDLTRTDPRTEERVERLAAAGTTLRGLDPADLEAELLRLHALSVVAFADNYLYSPIDAASFVAMYSAIATHLVPELVLLAEAGGTLVGYVFAVPDLLAARRSGAARTLVVKTVAVSPDHAGMGLGSVLVDLCQRAGHELGYERAIHALMHETNRSRAISGHYGATIRRYTLYVQDLEPALP